MTSLYVTPHHFLPLEIRTNKTQGVTEIAKQLIDEEAHHDIPTIHEKTTPQVHESNLRPAAANATTEKAEEGATYDGIEHSENKI